MSKSLGRSTLPEPVGRFAQAEVAAGQYPSVEDVLTAGVEALRERLLYARDLWKERAAAADRGEFSEGMSAEMMARIRARVEGSAVSGERAS
jgi:Arc/MetJ-type ribon-helix-helix transcriptional regulator